MWDAAYLIQCGRFRKISMPVSVVRKCIKFYKAECLFLLRIKFNDAVDGKIKLNSKSRTSHIFLNAAKRSRLFSVIL